MSENIPAGWKLVPIAATEAMEAAAVSRVRPYHDTDWRQHMPKDLFRLAWPALLDAVPRPPLPISMGGKFGLGDRVRKTKGSSWQGRVVGFYNTELTPIGYAVESEREARSVQIYPESALVALTDAEASAKILTSSLSIGSATENEDGTNGETAAASQAPAELSVGHEQRAIGIGMAIAAGIIMRSWGNDTYAREILGAAGLDTFEKLKASRVDQYDIDALKSVVSAPEVEG